MDYKSVTQIQNDIVVAGIKHFDLAQTLDNGQAFRWASVGEGKFSGIAHGRRLELEFINHGTTDEGNLILKDVVLTEFESTWHTYFDLDRSYVNLRRTFSKHDTLTKALAFSPGLRLMRQDTWEILISFILSQNSNIPRIKKMIQLLCENFGQLLPCGGHTFPTAKALAVLAVKELDVIRSGYRSAYIIDAARRVASGLLDLNHISAQPTEDIRAALLQVHGVGPKVADCVLLFGFGRLECFPLDVWMKRVVAELYPEGFPTELAEYAGIAQQFLFHYARSIG